MEYQEYVCIVCRYTFNEKVGDPEGEVKPETRWEDVPEDYCCPICGAGKSGFKKVEK